MRFHLLIQRHGLPATRILWTTTASSGSQSTREQDSSAQFASTPAHPANTISNANLNGGYTIAQFLEDVNEVVPLETETGLFDNEYSGQWGLEDYVVETGGSECLHYMEVEGLLRDGDEVVIRGLQLPDLRARRLTGRHQISADGRHLIDGIPFGRPYSKRSVASRPVITIPPRKKRRTLLSSRGGGRDEDEDVDWAPLEAAGPRQLAVIHDDEFDEDGDEEDADALIEDAPASDSDADESDAEEEDLADELQGLKEDSGPAGVHDMEVDDTAGAYALRTRSSPAHEPTDKSSARSPSVASKPSSEKEVDSSPKSAKAVRFNVTDMASSPPSAEARTSSSDGNLSSESESPSDTSDEETSSDEDSTSQSESEDESDEEDTQQIYTPPGQGSSRTKKTNHRNKLRRRLARLKEVGVMHDKAGFAELRAFEQSNPDYFTPPTPPNLDDAKVKEKEEFEAKRQKLLQDLESGGVDVDAASEKENVPPRAVVGKENFPPAVVESEKMDVEGGAEPAAEEPSETPESQKRRKLDVKSSMRLLFGSLGVRTPKTKEDEEATRKKLAGKIRPVAPQKEVEPEGAEEEESEDDETWRDKLILRATECVYDDIELTAPPFPFQQRWDKKANKKMRQRRNQSQDWQGQKRKREYQSYDGEAEEEDVNGDYENGVELNYDDSELVTDADQMDGVEESQDVDDLPTLPTDLTTLADISEDDIKRGSIIAFKQLDMSKATNWQPKMSEYRVAEVLQDDEHGTFDVRLATRDRRPAADMEDEEGGRRYSGFEMPGYEEDEVDDGLRNVTFAELIDPKLLRGAAAGQEQRPSLSPIAAATPKSTTEVEMDEAEQPVEDAEGESPHEHEQGSAANEQNEEPRVQSPEFTGFDSSSSSSSSSSSDSDSDSGSETDSYDGNIELVSPTRDQEANGDGDDDVSITLPIQNNVSSQSTSAPNSPEEPPTLQPVVSSPKSFTSFDRILEDFIQGRHRSSSTPSPERSSERPQSSPPGQEIEQDVNQDAEQNGSTEIEVETEPAEPADPSNPPSDDEQGQEPVEVDAEPDPDPEPELEGRKSREPSVAESAWEGKDEGDDEDESQPLTTQPAHVKTSPQVVVDLTLSSPPASGSDSGFPKAKSQPLPRGPGWVQKSTPPSQRQTRASTGRARKEREIKGVSESPTDWKGKRRSLRNIDR